MKTELKIALHHVLPDTRVFEIRYGEELIGTITGLEGEPGVKILSKYLTNSKNDIVIIITHPVPTLEVKLRLEKTVHILMAGRALCKEGMPSAWRPDERWVTMEDKHLVTCPDCLRIFPQLRWP